MRPSSSPSDGLFGPLFTDAAVEAELTDEAVLHAWLEAEAALALALADVGIVPAVAADAIAAAARALPLDVAELGRAAVATGNPVPPLVARLGAAVPETARPWVHFGATSQDIIDTGLVLAHRSAARLVADRVHQAADLMADLAVAHRDTLAVARTLGQHAMPTTFGLRVAGWLVPARRSAWSLTAVADSLPAQLGGAVGTLAAYGEQGLQVRRAFAHRLGLAGGDAILAWHTDRSCWLELAGAYAAIAAALGKTAADVRLLAATEVAEVVTGADGSGGSSAMPHKRNPVEAILATAGVVRVPGLVATIQAASVHAQERADGAWHSEWEPLRELASVGGGIAARSVEMLASLLPDPERMRHNLDQTDGAVMAEAVASALAAQLGRDTAQQLVTEATRRAAAESVSLRDALLATEEVVAVLGPAGVDAALDPASRLGIAGVVVDEVVRQFGRRDPAPS
jgi:3-carboxy-cis,cis-muconate cycloisomerase